MTRRQQRTLAAGVVFAASAGLVGVWAAGGGSREPIGPPPSGSLPELTLRPAPALAALSATLQRPLFTPGRRPAAVAAAGAAAATPPPASNLLAVGVGPDRSVAILKLTTGGTAVLMQGEQLDGWTLALVAADRVELRSGTQLAELRLAGR